MGTITLKLKISTLKAIVVLCRITGGIAPAVIRR